MSGRYQLRGVGDAVLLAGLVALVRQGNEVTSDTLAHLGEVEDRLLHAELGYPSLHAYCVQALAMSEGAAGRRVAGARVCRRFPVVFGRVARGELHLSALCALARHLTAENAAELFDACAHKSRRQVDEWLAVRFPRADVKEQVRRLSIEPLSAGRFGVHFTADGELRDLIERARAIASHRLARRDLSALMRLVFAEFVAREEQRRFAVGSKRTVKLATSGVAAARVAAPPGGVRREYISASVRRAVYARDAGRCSFVARDGTRCECREFLELDHVRPWAWFGAASEENLRLRCRAHNQLHARRCFGRLRVTARVEGRAVSGLWRRGGARFRRTPGRQSGSAAERASAGPC